MWQGGEAAGCVSVLQSAEGARRGMGGSLSQPRQYSPPRTPSLLHWALALLSFNQYQVDW